MPLLTLVFCYANKGIENDWAIKLNVIYKKLTVIAINR